MLSINRRRLGMILRILTTAGMLSGCASYVNGLKLTMWANSAPRYGPDSCHAYRVSMAAASSKLFTAVTVGAVVGMEIGVVAGAATRTGWGILAGLAGGAVVGSLTGAAIERWMEEHPTLVPAVNDGIAKNLTTENGQISQAQFAFGQLMACRSIQARQVQMAYQERMIDLRTAQTEMAIVRERAESDVAHARLVSDLINSRYQQWSRFSVRVRSAFVTVVKRGKPISTKYRASVRKIETLAGSNAALRDAFAERVSVAQAQVANGFQLAS